MAATALRCPSVEKRGNTAARRRDTRNAHEDFQKYFCVQEKFASTTNVARVAKRSQYLGDMDK